jgi:hypothetical protein
MSQIRKYHVISPHDSKMRKIYVKNEAVLKVKKLLKLVRILVRESGFYDTALLAGVAEDEAAGFAELEVAGLAAAGAVFPSFEARDSPLGSEGDLETPVAPVEDFLESLI